MKIKRVLKRIVSLLVGICCLMTIGGGIYAQEEGTTYVIKAFVEPEVILYDVEKGSLFDLKQQFPKEIDVVLDTGETKKIAVDWQCEMDYEMTFEPSYKFDVILPEGYVLADGVEKAFVGVVLKDAYEVNPTVHFDENNAGITLDTYLGATGIVEHLNSHRTDGYYIGTPYAGWSSGTANWVCMTPNGAPYNGWYAGMNCTGFVQYVLQACGGDWTKINIQGNCNLSAWTYAMLYNNLDDQIKVWKFNSKEEMLASGKLMKGDIIMMEPTYAGSWSGATDIYGNYIDCHIGFYWGDDTNKDMFWHSSHATYGLGWTILDGPGNGSGNQISNVTPKCSGNVFYVFPINHQGYIQISKTFSGGNSNYNPDADPAHYTIYTDAACTIPAQTLVGASTFRIEKNFKSGEIPIKAGTYYVKETRSPSGWNMDTKVYTIKVTDENTVSAPAMVSSANTKKITEGYLKIVKSSGNSSITDSNSNYSLSGAVYGVYSDASCKTKVKQLTTGNNGQTSGVKLTAGTHYVKELTAPKGYKIDASVYTVKITASHTSKAPYVLKVNDLPYVDTLLLTLNKVDATDTDRKMLVEAPLSGARFTIKYYAGYYTKNDLPENATRTWVIETKEEKNVNEEYVYRAALADAYKVGGDPLYYQDKAVVLPLGTISVEETKAPDGYTMEGGYMLNENGEKSEGVYVTQIKENGGEVAIEGGHALSVANYYMMRSVTLTKRIDADEINFANGNPSFIFKLEGTDLSGQKHTYYKMLIFTPEIVSGVIGDVSLSVTFDNLVAGTYTASEEAVARYSLNAISDVVNGKISGKEVVFDLITNTNGTAVFYNKVMEHGWFSGNSTVINSIEFSHK